MNTRNFSSGMLLAAFAISSTAALGIDPSYDPTIEVQASEAFEDVAEYLAHPAHAIFVMASEDTRGIAEEIRKESLVVITVGRAHHVLKFLTVSEKAIQVPFFTLSGAEHARDGILLGKSIDLSSCEHDLALFEAGRYHATLGCVVGFSVKQRGYFCQRTDRTPLVTSYDAKSYEQLLPATTFKGPEREVTQGRCTRYGNVR